MAAAPTSRPPFQGIQVFPHSPPSPPSNSAACGCESPDTWETKALFAATIALAYLSFKEDPRLALISFAAGLAFGANLERIGFKAKEIPASGGCGGTLPVYTQTTLPKILLVTYFFFKELSHLDHGGVNVVGAPFGLGVQLAIFLNNWLKVPTTGKS